VNILFFGDVVGRSGRDAVLNALPRLKKEYRPALTIVNVDNAAHGFGTTPAVCDQFLSAGVDVLTGGDHIWDQKEIIPYLSKEKRLLRPHNIPTVNPGSGLYIHTCESGAKIAVLHLLGQVFHKEHAYCPFAAADDVLKNYQLKANVSAIFVDFHAEATSEKTAMGHYLDGRVTAVIGSHTHVATADARILDGGTAYQTDAGMCGDPNSVIGFKKEAPISRFLTKNTKHKLEVSTGGGKISGVSVAFDVANGKATDITRI
jgi:2',3'-cyclic-nucleotide 2'-phosphodiesterase